MENQVIDKEQTDVDLDFELQKNTTVELYGIVGENCGVYNQYNGSDKRLKERGFEVDGGIHTLRGYASIKTLAAISYSNYQDYQREQSDEHITEIHDFLDNVKEEAKFLPEIVLAVTEPNKVELRKYTHSSFKTTIQQGVIENLGLYQLTVIGKALSRVDGNHRLEAGKESDYYVPFCIIIWDKTLWEDESRLQHFDPKSNVDSEAFIFYFLNSKAKRLELEENYKGLVNSKNWTDIELAEVNNYLPLIKHFNKNWLCNKLFDKTYLHNPLYQIAEILEDINDLKIDQDKFDDIITKSITITSQVDKFEYIKSNFDSLFFQLAFCVLYNDCDINNAIKMMCLIDKWLERYRYKQGTFVKAKKLYDISIQHLQKKEYSIFVAMPYYDEDIVGHYNDIFKEACERLTKECSNSSIFTYPIMSFKGKSFDIEEDILEKISQCDIFVADITQSNPNVLYELGMAANLKKPVIILKKKTDKAKIPSDIVLKYHVSFKECIDLKIKMCEHLKSILCDDFHEVF